MEGIWLFTSFSLYLWIFYKQQVSFIAKKKSACLFFKEKENAFNATKFVSKRQSLGGWQICMRILVLDTNPREIWQILYTTVSMDVKQTMIAWPGVESQA